MISLSVYCNIMAEVVVKGFKECCISSAVDGTDDDVLCSDSEGGDSD